ncbi:hypothetical protein KFK09_009199 [Dendrobium nobile]|uniref:Uncharacterized protein n=1 Tax=Dendrobium nobile TaxID=94219 RepID=A0A8T3BRN1_DENNO|nr:hypothetical protein KFK09_009199 [Dendrobium nobile]
MTPTWLPEDRPRRRERCRPAHHRPKISAATKFQPERSWAEPIFLINKSYPYGPTHSNLRQLEHSSLLPKASIPRLPSSILCISSPFLQLYTLPDRESAMGNCQAAEAATVLIQHPGGRIERIYWSLSASKVMASNPGHYVAAIITSQLPGPNLAGAAAPVKHLKLLRPDDTLHIGHVYRLVSFEGTHLFALSDFPQILMEFVSKKHVRLSKLVNASKEKRRSRSMRGEGDPPAGTGETLMQTRDAAADGKRGGEAAAPPPRMRQWRPALQSIDEVVGS